MGLPFFDLQSDSPLEGILPLSSLLIFSAISFLSSSVGIIIITQLLSRPKDFVVSTENFKIDYVMANKLADFFLSTSGLFAIASLGILVSAVMFSFEINKIGWILKFIVLVIFSWCFLLLAYFVLIKLRMIKPEAEEYQKLYIEFLSKGNK